MTKPQAGMDGEALADKVIRIMSNTYTEEWQCNEVRALLAAKEAELVELREALEELSMLDAGVPGALLTGDYKGACRQFNEDRHSAAKLARHVLAKSAKTEGAGK